MLKLTALLLSVLCLLPFASSKEFIVAKNDGSMSIGWNQVFDGIYNDNNNYFISTLHPDYVTPNLTSPYFFYKVEMGDFIDYYIPVLIGSDVVQAYNALGGGVGPGGNTRAITYSSMNPLDDKFDGYSVIIPNSGPVSIYGGTQLGAPSDGRLYGSAWGGGSSGGGCCCSNASEINQIKWKRPYVITAIDFDPKYIYLRIISAPSIAFFGQTVGVAASLLDIFMRSDSSLGIKPTWTLSYKDKTESTENGDLTAAMKLEETVSEDMAPIYHIVTIDNKSFWPDNSRIKKSNFTISKPVYILAPSTFLNFGGNITRMLRYSNSTDASAVMTAKYADTYTAESIYWFANETTIQPKLNENMTATGVDDDVNKGKIYNWKWIEVNSASGLFGNSVDAPNSYQYFAFAVFSTVPQTVRFTVICPETCFTYVDGDLFENAVGRDEVNSFENEVFLSEGWHQFLAKVVTEDTIPADQGFIISFNASGLATYDNMLSTYPYTNTKPVNPSETSSKKLSIGAIVGIVIACVVVVVAIALILKFTLFRKPSVSTKEKENPTTA